MPLYDFKCKDCSHEEEVYCKAEEKDETRPCPKCGGEMDKVPIQGLSTFVLKGRGWYEDGY